MEKLYFLVSKCELYQSKGLCDFFGNYFSEGSGFMTSFLIALAVAVVGLIVFYGWFANFSYRLTNLGVWLTVLALVGIITIALTKVVVIGDSEPKSGFFAAANTYWENKIENESPEICKQITSNYNEVVEKMKEPACEVSINLYLTNLILSLLMFFGLSIVVKNFTIHGKSIPF